MTELRSRGIQPDVIVCRSDAALSSKLKQKISDLCDVPVSGVVSAADASDIYEIPLILHREGLDSHVCRLLRFDGPEYEPDLSKWTGLMERARAATRTVRIGLVVKYDLRDAYLSVVEALRHAGYHHLARVEIEWIHAHDIETAHRAGPAALHALLGTVDGLVIGGGFGTRALEGKIAAAGYAREHRLPCLGICLGLQMMVVEFARSVAGLVGASSRELDPHAPYLVIDLMDEQRNIVNMGGTMRLGSHPAKLLPDTHVGRAYGRLDVSERHRHRFEVSPQYRRRLEDAGLVCSGTSPDDVLVEYVEIRDHPFWVGTQAHPEFRSRPDAAHPLFRDLLAAALERPDGAVSSVSPGGEAALPLG